MLPSTRAGWLGIVAGTASGLLVVGALFVGPYRQFALGGGGVVGVVPVASVDNPAWPAVASALAGTAVLGVVAGAADGLYGDPADLSWGEVASAVAYGPLLVLVALAVAVVVWRASQVVASAGVARATVAGLVTSLVVVPAALVLGVVASLFVLLPAVAGVYAGSRLGRAARPG